MTNPQTSTNSGGESGSDEGAAQVPWRQEKVVQHADQSLRTIPDTHNCLLGAHHKCRRLIVTTNMPTLTPKFSLLSGRASGCPAWVWGCRHSSACTFLWPLNTAVGVCRRGLLVLKLCGTASDMLRPLRADRKKQKRSARDSWRQLNPAHALHR